MLAARLVDGLVDLERFAVEGPGALATVELSERLLLDCL